MGNSTSSSTLEHMRNGVTTRRMLGGLSFPISHAMLHARSRSATEEMKSKKWQRFEIPSCERSSRQRRRSEENDFTRLLISRPAAKCSADVWGLCHRTERLEIIPASRF